MLVETNMEISETNIKQNILLKQMVREISCWGIVLSANCQLGEVYMEEVSVGDLSFGKCQAGNCPHSALFCFIITFYFLNSKTNVVTNLNPFTLVRNSFSLFLIADSESLCCSIFKGIQNFNIIRTHITFTSIVLLFFLFYSLCFIQKKSVFVFALYKN